MPRSPLLKLKKLSTTVFPLQRFIIGTGGTTRVAMLKLKHG
jgi:hypothetical protein